MSSAGPGPTSRRGARAELVALAVAAALVAAAFLAEPLGWWGGDVHQWLPPMSAHWDPVVGPALVAAAAVAAAAVGLGPRLAARLRWGWLLAATWATGVAWGLSLALVRGWSTGVVGPVADPHEYLHDVPRVHGVHALLSTYTRYVLSTAHHHWVTQDSGHPPLPLLLYAGLARLGLPGPGAAAVATVAVGSTGVVAVLVALAALGGADRARRAAPFLALSPTVLWSWVSTDGAFAAVVAWGLALLALGAARSRQRWTLAGALLSATAGSVLGASVFLSYGLVLAGLLALGVLVAAGAWRPLVPAALVALAVVGAFAADGFWWLAGERLLVVRYYQGKGALRPYGYWVWGDLALVAVTTGPAVVAGLGRAVAEGAAGLRSGLGTGLRTGLRTGVASAVRRPSARAALLLGACAAILVADVTGLSKSEVERIWLPFTLWLALAATWLSPGSPRASRRWLAAQATWAVLVEVLLRTTW